MASDWIALRTNLTDDPAIISIAVTLGLDEYGVVGRLHKLWSWADQHTVDGNARSVSTAWVDRFLSTPGFAAAMLDAGWLQCRSGGLLFPNFNRWNTQTAKQRLLTAKRVAAHKTRGNGKGNDPLTLDALPTRQDKTREEEEEFPAEPGPRKTTDPPPAGPPKAKKPPTGEHHETIAYFCDRWQEKYGVKYPFAKKDAAHIRDLLAKAGGAVPLRPVIDRFLADDSPFHAADSRHDLGALLKGYKRWLVDAPLPTGGYRSKAERDIDDVARQFANVLGDTHQ